MKNSNHNPAMPGDEPWWSESHTTYTPATLSPEKAQDLRIAEWAKSLPEHERRMVEGLPRLASETYYTGTGSEKDVAQWNEASETPDLAEVLDRDHERIMEQFGLHAGQAAAVVAWVREREHEAARTMQAKVLGAIVSTFLGAKCADAKVVFWALAFQSGLARHMTHHNPHSKSKELGVTRALISRWQKVWQDVLGLYDLTYSKTEEAREKYRKARIAYCEKKKQAKS